MIYSNLNTSNTSKKKKKKITKENIIYLKNSSLSFI